MTDESVSNRIITIPNIVSFIRVLTVPVFWWVLLVQDNVRLAAVIVIAIGWTDWIDGYLARRLNQVTKLGKILDPFADRLMIASAVIGGLITGVVPQVIGIPLVVREVVMGAVTLTMLQKRAGTLKVRYLGKLATAALYGAIPAFYLAEAGFIPGFTFPFAWTTGVIGLIAYWIVAVLYMGDARRALANVESTAEPEES